jgi:hypothetical protein
VTTSGNDKAAVKRQRAILEEAILKTDMIGGERASERQGKRRKNGMIGGGKRANESGENFLDPTRPGRRHVVWRRGVVASWSADILPWISFRHVASGAADTGARAPLARRPEWNPDENERIWEGFEKEFELYSDETNGAMPQAVRI